MSIQVQPNRAQLTWAAFRVVDSIPGTTESAQVNPTMTFPRVGPQQVRGKFRLPSFTITVAPNALKTMVLRTANRTPELLEHEQGHFNIQILAARALARELESLEADSSADLQAQWQEAAARHNDRAQDITDDYDDQTDHSRNTSAQMRWNTLLSAALSARPPVSEIARKPL